MQQLKVTFCIDFESNKNNLKIITLKITGLYR